MNKGCIKIENWNLITVPNAELKDKKLTPYCVNELLGVGYSPIQASVPGNFELDLMREGQIPDLYYGSNILISRKLENLHLFYYTEFTYTPKTNTDAFLIFNGIDTAAEIFLDGQRLGFVENMHHAHKFDINHLSEGNHSLFVHILPTAIHARNFEVPSMCFGLPYNHDSVNIRKAPYMFGWDIMPRLISGGIYKDVEIVYLPKTRIENTFTYTHKITENTAMLYTSFDVETDADLMTDFTAVITGRCKDSSFSKKITLFGKHQGRILISVTDPYLWWPKNYGEPNMYDIEITLYYKGVECDKTTYKHGIKTVFLRRSSTVSDDGDFCFIVNDKRIFCMGTNWVPTDAFPSRHESYELRGLEMIKDTNCNMIRCWGGNTYPSHAFYDFCDENGIMVWQDFSLGCAHYPDDERLCNLVKEEVKQVALKYRNHPALVLYAGDNECDMSIMRQGTLKSHHPLDTQEWLNPNLNKLTRDTILHTLRNYDATRPYLPSSPYIDEYAFYHGQPSENHLWGPRDYFKGEFYKNPVCHFASEMGYHGCPSPKSLAKFIPEDSLHDWGTTSLCSNINWLAHATVIEPEIPDAEVCYAYRIPLMVQQIERIFDKIGDDITTFARQSQISQAEALKYFIEHFRAEKWRKTGLVWWNIIDGWPQISDAVVDWYGCKKLAYHYIKRSQNPFTMLLNEPENGEMQVIACNDSRDELTVEYTIKNLVTEQVVCKGNFKISADEKIVVETVPHIDHAFFLIEWKTNEGNGKNHHVCSLGDKWQYEQYIACMQKAGFYDEFEGF